MRRDCESGVNVMWDGFFVVYRVDRWVRDGREKMCRVLSDEMVAQWVRDGERAMSWTGDVVGVAVDLGDVGV